MIQQGVLTISKIFNIRPAEWPRFLILYAMYFVFVTGSIWAEIVLESAFIDQLGTAALARFLVVKSIVSVLAFAIYTAFADRVANDRLLVFFLIFTGLAISSGLGLLFLGIIIIAYPMLYLLIFVPLDELFVAHWYTYVNDFYDTRSAKRIIPVLSTAGRVAGIFGGLTITMLRQLLPSTAGIIVLWLITLLIMGGLARLMPYLLKKDQTEETFEPLSLSPETTSDHRFQSFVDNLREGYRYVSQSTFLRWLAINTFLLIVLVSFLQFQTWNILKFEFQNEQEISRFFGNVTWITNLIILPFQLFLLSRIIGRVGVGNANLIFPSGMLIISGTLLGWTRPFTAALAHFGRTNFYGAIGYPIDSLLYNAVPLRVKGRARAFIGGLVAPTGTLIGGLLLITPLVQVSWFVPLIIGTFGVLIWFIAFIVRRQYGQALVEMLEQEDFSFLLSQKVSDLSEADPTTLLLLKQKLLDSSDPKFIIFMAQLITQLGDQAAIPILSDAAQQSADPETRAGLIDVLVTADLQGDEVRQFYADFLTDPDPQVRQSAILGLEQLVGPDHEDFLTPALQMLDNPNVEARTQILLALADSNDFYALPAAVESLNQLLDHEDPQQRVYGLQVLTKIADVRTRQSTTNVTKSVFPLTMHLSDPNDEVRLRAAQGIETISKNKLTPQLAEIILQQMSSLIDDPVERIRQATLVVYGRLGNEEAHPILLKALTDSSARIRVAAVDTIVEVGDPSIIPSLKAHLDDPNRQLRKMATITLSRINPREFGGLIEAQVADDLATVYRNIGLIEALSPCSQFQSISVLQSTLREQNQTLIDEIFQLIAADYERKSIEILTTSLQSSDERVRANALEALEAMLTPQTAQLMAPWFDPEVTTAQLVEIGRETQGIEQPTPAEAIGQIISNLSALWSRVIVTYSLGEMGAALSENGAGEQQSPPKKGGRSRRSRADDALAILAESGSEDKPKKRRPRPADLLAMLTDDNQDRSSQPEEPPKTGDQSGSQVVPLTLPEIEAFLSTLTTDPAPEVLSAAKSAKRMLAGFDIIEEAKKEDILLSTIERIIFLKQVPFFKGMNIHQLEVLAKICEEKLFEEDQWIFHQGDPGGALYVIVNGRIGIEQEKRKGSYARLATLGAHDYFGEMTLFDNSPRSASAVTLQDTLTLRLRREPLIALARQYPDLSLELIHTLSERLRQANQRIADLTRSRPRELQKLFDTLD